MGACKRMSFAYGTMLAGKLSTQLMLAACWSSGLPAVLLSFLLSCSGGEVLICDQEPLRLCRLKCFEGTTSPQTH